MLDSFGNFFQNNNLREVKYGLKGLPYTIVSKFIPGCHIGPDAISIYQEQRWRVMIEANAFIAVAPGEKRALSIYNGDGKELCITTIPTAPFPISLAYQIVKADKNYFSEDEMNTIRATKSEFDAVKAEVDSLQPKVRIDLKYYSDRLNYYANYNTNVARLNTTKLTSAPFMVVLTN